LPALRLAIFDLDGTLTRRDTFAPFILRLLLRHPDRWWRMVLLLPPIAAWFAGRSNRGRLKGAIVHALFAGLTRNEVNAWSDHYSQQVVAGGMFAEALLRFRAHQSAGDITVLLSASPDLYVPRIAAELGASEVHCTQLKWNGDRLDGRLIGENRRGAEKVKVLEQLRARHPGLAAIAYGNSSVDLAHMVLCEESVYVNGSANLRQAHRAPGLTWVDWK
jgi:phosphatidylglycerophosphatase C